MSCFCAVWRSKNSDEVYGGEPHSLRWRLPLPSVSPATATAILSEPTTFLRPEEQPIHAERIASGSHLPDDFGTGEDRGVRAVELQRRVSIDHRTSELPESDDVATISDSFRSGSFGFVPEGP